MGLAAKVEERRKAQRRRLRVRTCSERRSVVRFRSAKIAERLRGLRRQKMCEVFEVWILGALTGSAQGGKGGLCFASRPEQVAQSRTSFVADAGYGHQLLQLFS